MSDAYKKARKRAERDYHEALASSHSPFLHALDEMLAPEDTSGTETVGLIELPLHMVVGTRTAGRQHAFSRNFMPLLAPETEFASKWSHLYSIQVREGFRDPIKVFEFMHRFYVQEGNKRVSVLKFLDAPTVMADVTRLIPSKWEGPEQRLYGEFLEFWRAVPIYDLDFSREGSYRKLAKAFGRNLRSPWPTDAVENLRCTFQFFEAVYNRCGGSHLDITSADAMLTYLGFYPGESILDTPASVLSSRIGKVWNELLLEGESDNLALVDSPGQAEVNAMRDSERLGEPVRPTASPQVKPATRSIPKALDNPVSKPLVDALSRPLSALGRRGSYSEQRPLRMSFIYRSNTYVSRWALAHDLGREKLENKFGGLVVTEKYVDCGSDRLVREAIDKAVAGGADVVVTTSPVQMNETARAAIRYPDVHFLNCSVNLPRQAVRSYYGRTYEIKFLMGALAASLSDNHLIGYRADRPIYGTVADINAFAIGAGIVDPQAKIVLKWASLAHADWRAELAEEGVTVISGADAAHPFADDNTYGLYRVMDSGSAQAVQASHQTSRESCPSDSAASSCFSESHSSVDGVQDVVNLALPVWNWDRYYELIVQSILQGSWEKVPTSGHAQAVNYWYGISSGVIDVALPLSLPYYSRKLVDMLRTGIVQGAVDPFAGELHSQESVVKGEGSAPLTSAQIVSMDWLNDNVVGCIPDASQLTRPAREEVQVSGVKEK